MPKNKLYRVIKSKLNSTSFTVPNVQKILHLTNKVQESFYLFELSLNEKIIIGDYTLTSHHISVYENHRDGFTSNSQYHYTAYFADNSGTEYRLHSYHDTDDNLISKPILARKTTQNTYETIPCENENEFKDLAPLSISDWVFYIRRLQWELIEQLHDEYQLLDINTCNLSVNLAENKIAYIQAVDLQIKKLQELCLYAHDIREFSRIHLGLSNIKKSVVLSLDILSAKEEVTMEEEISDNIITAPQIPHIPQFAFTSKAVKKQTSMQEVLLGLNAEYSALDSTLSDNKLIASLNRLHMAINDQQLAVDLGNVKASTADLHELDQLYTKIKMLSVPILQRFLVKGEYESAKKMQSFYPYLPITALHFALIKDNASLLEFLLHNKIINSVHKKLTVAGKEYSSLVEYCFKNTDAKLSKAGLLGVLIRYNSELLMTPDSSGLPYAAVFLLQPKHPLCVVFENHSQQTMANPLFIKRLNQVLLLAIAQVNCPSDRRNQLNDLIAANKRKLEQLHLHTAIGGTYVVQAANESHSAWTEVYGQELMEKIQADEDITKYNKQITEKTNKLLKKLSPKEQREISKQLKIDYKTLKTYASTLKGVDLTQMFDLLKTTVIDYQENALRALDLRYELIDVQAILRKPSYGNKISSAQTKATFRQTQILTELKIIDKSLRVFDPAQSQVQPMSEVALKSQRFLMSLDSLFASTTQLKGLLSSFSIFSAGKNTAQPLKDEGLPLQILAALENSSQWFDDSDSSDDEPQASSSNSNS